MAYVVIEMEEPLVLAGSGIGGASSYFFLFAVGTHFEGYVVCEFGVADVVRLRPHAFWVDHSVPAGDREDP